jgi:hypothetical protein
VNSARHSLLSITTNFPLFSQTYPRLESPSHMLHSYGYTKSYQVTLNIK